MATDDPTNAAAVRHRRRLRIALCIANAIVVNELVFAFGIGGLRVPMPALEHYGRLLPLSLPVLLHYTLRPGRRRTVLGATVLGAVAKAPLLVLANAFVGGVISILALALTAGLSIGGASSVLIGALSCFAIVTALWLGAPRWSHVRSLVWLPPACTAFACFVYAPPFTVARLPAAHGAFLVEAGLVCLPSNPVVRVCSVTPLLPGALEWWHTLDTLPSTARDVTLRQEGSELVVAFCAEEPAPTPPVATVRRIRLE